MKRQSEMETDETTLTVGDAELVARAKAGELDAFEALTNRYEQRVYSLALRMLRQEQDAEDVTQQTFLSALEHLDGFRGEARFATWLLRIATHAALKIIRKRAASIPSPWNRPPKKRTTTAPFLIPNTWPIGGSPRSNWCSRMKPSGCWTTR